MKAVYGLHPEKWAKKLLMDIKRAQIDALFLSLSAAQIIVLQQHNSEARWNITWLIDDTPAFNKDSYWQGVNAHPETRPRSRVPRNVPAHAIIGMQRSMQSWLDDTEGAGGDEC